MEAAELRIGNYVTEQGRLILLHDGFGIDHAHNFEPIEITEEWLLRFGFEIFFYEDDCRDYKYYKKIDEDKFSVFIIEESQIDEGYWKIDIDMAVEIKQVHQLQNLYFAVIGDELTIKN